jgi:perosamine synthetase
VKEFKIIIKKIFNSTHMANLVINGGEKLRTKPFPAHKYILAEEKAAVNRVMDTGILSKYLGCWHDDFYGGTEVQAFEKEWAEYFNVKHAIAVNSCTSGLIAALGAIGIEPGDEVIVTPYTMSATASAALWWGAIPVFADIEEDYFCIDPDSVEKLITPRTKAIMAVDIFGQPYDADKLNAIAKKHGIYVIEDTAQAPEAKLNGKFAGTLGDIGVYSLNYHKHIHTGEGGVIVTDNDELAEKMQLIRNHAESVVEDKEVTDLTNMVGQNYRLTEIQAAIGREQLKKLGSLVEERVGLCDYLAEKLGAMPGISIPPVREGATHAYYVQPMKFDEKEVGVDRNTFILAVKAELPVSGLREDEGPLLSYGYTKPLYLFPMFQKRIAMGSKGYPWTLMEDQNSVSYEKGICPVVERMYEKELFLNEIIRPPATKEDLDDVVAAFQKVYDNLDELKK